MSLQAASIFCARSALASGTAVLFVRGLLQHPLGCYIVRSPQLDERFGPRVTDNSTVALCSALQSELEITLVTTLR